MPQYLILHKRAMSGVTAGVPVLRRPQNWAEALETVLRMGGETAVALYERDDDGLRGPLNGNIDWQTVRMERKAVKARYFRQNRKPA